MDTRGGRQHLCPTVERAARLRRPQETRADLAAGIGLGCGSGRWVRRSGVILNPLTEAGLFARPDLALHAASTGRCGGRRPLTHTQAAKSPTRRAPWHGQGQALAMASFRPLRPAWPPKEPLSSSRSLEDRPPSIRNPTGHRAPGSLPSLSRSFWALTLLQRATVYGWRARSKSHTLAMASMPSR